MNLTEEVLLLRELVELQRQEIAELKTRIVVLEAERKEDKARIAALEAKLGHAEDRVVLGGDTGIERHPCSRSMGCVSCDAGCPVPPICRLLFFRNG